MQPRLHAAQAARGAASLVLTPGLPSAAWMLQAGVVLNFFGNGLVAPYLILHLHAERGIALPLASLAVASGGILATTSGLVAGPLIDRIGPRTGLALAMAANALAYAAYTQVRAPWQAFAAGLGVGVGTGAYGPNAQALVSAIVAPEQRAAALSQQRMSAVLGLSLGGLAGGVLVAAGVARGYSLLLVLDSLTFLGFSLLVQRLPNPRPVVERHHGRYVDALRDRRLRVLAGANLAIVSFAVAPMLWILPPFARGASDVPAAAIGMIYAVNAAFILVAQLRITKAVSTHQPLRVLALAAAGWVVAWAIAATAGATLRRSRAALAFVAVIVVYALSECLYTGSLTPSVVAIAPPHLRGRYLAVIGFTWQAGFSIGPPLAAAVLAEAPTAFPLGECACCLVMASVLWLLRWR